MMICHWITLRLLNNHTKYISISELGVQKTAEFKNSTSNNIFIEIDKEGKLVYKLYDNLGYFKFPIVNFKYQCGNIPVCPAYNFMCRSWFDTLFFCSNYQNVLKRALLLSN